MRTRTWWVIGAVVAALGAGVAIGVLLLGDEGDERVVRIGEDTGRVSSKPIEETRTLSVDEDGRPISDEEIGRIVEAAIVAAGGGQVSDIERSDDPGEAFEVEVIRDGGEIDIALDENLRRVPNNRFTD